VSNDPPDTSPIDNGRILFFYSLSYGGRLVFLALLTAVLSGTAGQVVWRLAWPINNVTGTLTEVTETRRSNHSAVYNLALRTDEDELFFIRLRNNGRILRAVFPSPALSGGNQLPAPNALIGRQVLVRYQRGVAVEVAFLDGVVPAIRESTTPAVVLFMVALLALIILFLLAQPHLVERLVMASSK
jgi:hypothetical protein